MSLHVYLSNFLKTTQPTKTPVFGTVNEAATSSFSVVSFSDLTSDTTNTIYYSPHFLSTLLPLPLPPPLLAVL